MRSCEAQTVVMHKAWLWSRSLASAVCGFIFAANPTSPDWHDFAEPPVRAVNPQAPGPHQGRAQRAAGLALKGGSRRVGQACWRRAVPDSMILR